METANIGAGIMVLLGLLGLLVPERLSRVVGVAPAGALGVSEVRATYGGFFLGLGVACLVAQSRAAFVVAGTAWGAAAFARILSVVFDHSRTRENYAGILIEAGMAALLLSTSADFWN
jgi:hypothetical protein